jgi:ABC-type phosphate transport system substrate-binding protein
MNIDASSAAYPWLSEAYDCAPAHSALRLSNPESADISLRLGEPALGTLPAFQIGTEDILVVVHPQTGVRSLTLDQARRLFSGQVTKWKDLGGTDVGVEVWTFAPGEDIAAVFERTVMLGEPITSLARLAVSAQAMSDSVGSTPGSIGFLPRRLKASNTAEALVAASAPVLAISSSEPQGAIRDLLSCLQTTK